VKGCALLQGSRRWGDVSGEVRRVCMGEQDMSSAWVRSEWGGHLDARWKASFTRQLRSRRWAALNQPLKSVSLSLSMPDSAILSWVVEFNPLRNLSTIAIGSVYLERSMRSLNSSMYASAFRLPW
jgi:hypothetical protein